ncbi:HD domain-containing protein [Mycolicibacterium mageritense]|uniref:HD domain-containing protein n=1 Tax=Mycolicibacterium mageritense TaxID=53462 RepID=UPI0011D5ACF2|nr:HD domain-containing protein [Mycolicibacterium mageritense]TXI65336.1 MAG: HD domain-containing protein [Mycolicibacterium mageritense]
MNQRTIRTNSGGRRATLVNLDPRRIAEQFLADVLPRRWSHTIGVASVAADLADILAPEKADTIVAAAWLHDIGYAPSLVRTGFHPLDGAAYLATHIAPGAISAEVVNLVAHHTGAAFEARERGLNDAMVGYPAPTGDLLAILSCADLCTGPDGAPVDPGARIAEVLARYPAGDPVHRAISASGPGLVAEARTILDEAAMGACGKRDLGHARWPGR